MQLHDLRHHPVIKWLAYAGFALIIVSFIFFYGWQTGADQGLDEQGRPFAQFRSQDALSFLPWRRWDTITAGEVQKARQQVLNYKMSLLGPQIAQIVAQQGSVDYLATDDEAIEQAVNNRLLLREADRLKIKISDEDVDQYLRQQSGFTRETLNAFLAQNKMTLADFRDELRRDQVIDRARSAAGADARASLYELWLDYLLVNEKLSLALAPFPAEKYVDKTEVTDEELAARLKEDEARWKVPAKRQYRYVKVAREDLRAKIEATPEQLKAYYEQNPQLFRRQEAARIEDVLAPVNNDQSTTAAQAIMTKFMDGYTTGAWSERVDEILAANPEGRLYYEEDRWLERTPENQAIYGTEFMSRAQAMTDNSVTTGVESPRGIHAVRKIQTRPAETKPYEEVAAEVEAAYKDSRAGELLKAEGEKLREGVKRFTNIRDFAQNFGLEDKLTTWTLAGSSFIPEVGSFANQQRYIERLKPGQLSEVVPGRDVIAVLQIQEETPEHVPELSEVRAEVEAEVRREKAVKLAKEAADAAFEQVRTGEPIETVAADQATSITHTQPFTRLTPVEALGAPLIGFSRQSAGAIEGATGLSAYGTDPENPEGYAIWKVEKLEQPTREEFAAERRNFERQYLDVLQATVIEEYLADLRAKAEYRSLREAPPEPEPKA